MSRVEDFDEHTVMFHNPPSRCFKCGERLTVPCVMWNGIPDKIWLHSDCAEHLGERLIHDSKQKGNYPTPKERYKT
jgi:hypothetical protein